MDWTKLTAVLEELRRHPKSEDWWAKLLDISEEIWSALNYTEQVGSDLVNQFLRVLLLPETLTLARLVIPELRQGGSSTSKNPLTQKILEKTRSKRSRLAMLESITPAQFDSNLYAEEKFKRKHFLLAMSLTTSLQRS